MGSFGFGMFDIMSAIFPIMFILVLGVIIVVVIKGISQWSHNNAQPKIPAEAKVVSKRASVSHHQGNAGDVHHHTMSSTTYYVTFEFASGDRLELHVPDREYGMIAEGDSGILTSQGTRFISFERR
jgi:hypothetical protein